MTWNCRGCSNPVNEINVTCCPLVRCCCSDCTIASAAGWKVCAAVGHFPYQSAYRTSVNT